MARPKKNVRYFIIDDGNSKIVETADTIEEARASIASLSESEGDLFVIIGEQLEVTIDRSPRVVIGAEPKARTRKAKAIVNVDPALTAPPKKRGRPAKVKPVNGAPAPEATP